MSEVKMVGPEDPPGLNPASRWAVVEMMERCSLAGRATPGPQGWFVWTVDGRCVVIGHAAIYRVTRCTEEFARLYGCRDEGPQVRTEDGQWWRAGQPKPPPRPTIEHGMIVYALDDLYRAGGTKGSRRVLVWMEPREQYEAVDLDDVDAIYSAEGERLWCARAGAPEQAAPERRPPIGPAVDPDTVEEIPW